MRLENAITLFLSDWPSEGATEDTVRTYTTALRWVAGFAAQRRITRLDQLDSSFVRQAIMAKMAAPRGRRSANFKGGEAAASQLVSVLRRMVLWLQAQGVEIADDLSTVKPPSIPERVQVRLRQDEFRALEAAILHRLVDPERHTPRILVTRDLALLYLLSDTGLRAIEVCGMQVGMVDFERGWITVHRGKGKKDRILSLVPPEGPATTLKLLGDWVQARATVRGAACHDWLWISAKGRPLNRDELRRVLRRMCREAGLDGNRPPHTFRRGWFTEQYQANPANLPYLVARMGWSPKDHAMVGVYTRGAELEFAQTEVLPSLTTRWTAGSRVSPSPAQRGSTVSWWREGAGPVDPRRRQASGAGPVPAPPERSRPLAQ